CKHAPAIGQHDAAGIGGLRAVLSEGALDRDLVPLLQGILPPALLQEHRNGAQLEVPVGDLAVGFLNVYVEACVGIHPLHLGDDSRNFDGLVSVVFRGEGVMSQHRNGGGEKTKTNQENTNMGSHSRLQLEVCEWDNMFKSIDLGYACWRKVVSPGGN